MASVFSTENVENEDEMRGEVVEMEVERETSQEIGPGKGNETGTEITRDETEMIDATGMRGGERQIGRGGPRDPRRRLEGRHQVMLLPLEEQRHSYHHQVTRCHRFQDTRCRHSQVGEGRLNMVKAGGTEVVDLGTWTLNSELHLSGLTDV